VIFLYLREKNKELYKPIILLKGKNKFKRYNFNRYIEFQLYRFNLTNMI
jgi:hypothetical protein